MKKILFLITLAVALCAPAHAQEGQVQIKCVNGHNGCTLTHKDDDNGVIQDLGGNTGGNTGSSDTITDDDERPTKGNSRVGDDTITDSDDQDKPGKSETEIEKAERLACAERERIEKANKRIRDAKDNGDTEEVRLATQELMRAENKMRIEMDRKLDRVQRAATGSSAGLRSAIGALQRWQREMVKAGMKKDVVEFYVKNKESIGELLAAYGTEDKPGPLRWLAANQAAISGMATDYASLKEKYPDVAEGEYFKALVDETRAARSAADSASTTANAANTTANSASSKADGAHGLAVFALIGAIVAVIGVVLIFIFKK